MIENELFEFLSINKNQNSLTILHGKWSNYCIINTLRLSKYLNSTIALAQMVAASFYGRFWNETIKDIAYSWNKLLIFNR